MIDPAVQGDRLRNLHQQPGRLAGLKPGDEIVAVNGEKIYSSDAVIQLEEAMTNGPIKPVTLTVQRGNEQFDRALLAGETHPADQRDAVLRHRRGRWTPT